MRPILQRISPQVAIGIVAGYLFCDTFEPMLSLLAPVLGLHWKLPDLLFHVLDPFIAAACIGLVLGSRLAWIFMQVYIWFRIISRVVAGCIIPIATWNYTNHIPLPEGVSRPGLYVFIGLGLVLNTLVSVFLLVFLRRQDVKNVFNGDQSKQV